MSETTQEIVVKTQDLYYESTGLLALRIDYAWNRFNQLRMQEKEENEENEKQNLIVFLMYALNITPFEDTAEKDADHTLQAITTYMQLREKHQDVNLEYIPGKSPQHLELDPEEMHQGFVSSKICHHAINKEMLGVSKKQQDWDKMYRINYLDPTDRRCYRVNIHNGRFKQNNSIYDTEEMSSRKKKGFAAYTINAYGELSIFTHGGQVGGLKHSSMNSALPVFSAGDIVIQDGRLIALGTHSGHYQPTLFTLYRTLSYFKQQGIDISQTVIYTSNNTSHKKLRINSTKLDPPLFPYNYKISATALLMPLQTRLSEQIGLLEQKLTEYIQPSCRSRLFSLKDRLLGIKLTKDRNEMVRTFISELQNLKNTLPDQTNQVDINQKLSELKKMLGKYQTENALLSKKGRASELIASFKQKIDKIKPQKEENEQMKKMKNSY